MVSNTGVESMSPLSPVIIAPTPQGYRLAQRLQAGLGGSVDLWTREQGGCLGNGEGGDRPFSLPFKEVVADYWQHRPQLIFVLAVGAVVRLIAPLLHHKSSDPGVVVVDESGQFVISLCGGHQGGADGLCRQVAAVLGVEPVITSAATGQGFPALDVLGQPYGWTKGEGDWLAIATALVRQSPIQVIQTCGWELWRSPLPESHPFVFTRGYDASDLEPSREVNPAPSAILWISDQQPPVDPTPLACWHPRTLWIGVGCERGTSAQWLEQSLRKLLHEQGLAFGAIAGLASLDLKQDEIGLQTLAQTYHWPLWVYPAKTLAEQPVPNPSSVVNGAVGTPSVAEAAAIQAAQEWTRKFLPKSAREPEAELIAELIVPKHIFREESGRQNGSACTLAIARSPVEYSNRVGVLYLIGIGPGALDQLTLAARNALTRCDALVGYGPYLDGIQPLLQPAQVVERFIITQEVQRAERAIALAKRGLTVGVVSSGDCGIYGMAGLVLERLVAKDRDEEWASGAPQVRVFPGITALQAVAARVGAPLMHDFCAISLSDLLTPWPVILRRLEAAAQADFVVALYNPRSRTRTTGIEAAREVFCRWRSPHTPVIIARSVYRPDEHITQTTLEHMECNTIDMVSIVLIGNSVTFSHRDYLITPRGYGTNLESG